jgi:alkylhydroperoxidase family enzyme
VPTHVLLGRGSGLAEEKMAHLGDDPLPEGVYAEDEVAIVRYAAALTRMEPIDDDLYGALERHFDQTQIIELCFAIGLSNVVNRFHATFHTDLDESTLTTMGRSCPLPLPSAP